ncbi:MAG: glycerophosphodiester phosphodiesterase family protein [Caldilineaceae bacterium]
MSNPIALDGDWLEGQNMAKLINLHNPNSIADHRPIMIAHRGGAIATGAPENSLRAIELAAVQGYDMVELDLRRAKDGVPVLFHGHGSRGGMLVDCGVAANIEDFTSAELAAITYRGTSQSIITFEAALKLCKQLNLGIMLDIKTPDAAPLATDYLLRITALLEQYDLTHAMMTLCTRPEARQLLPSTTLWPIRARNLQTALDGDHSLHGHFWFDDPASATDEQIRQLSRRGALTIACLNSFRYPHHSFNTLERVDAERMKAVPVDGFQIDSCYGEFFEKLAQS